MNALAEMQKEWKEWSPAGRLAFVLVASVSAVSILFGILDYPVIGHDSYVHLNWLDQFTRLREQGIAYPRWLPDSFGGFGSPSFYFYPPLPYWIASFFYSIHSFSPGVLFSLLQLSAAIGSIITSYFLLRSRSTSALSSLFSALIYSFLAYRFCDVYVRNALGEHCALAFLPLVFIVHTDSLRRIAILTIGWTGLLLTNLPVAYIAGISTLVFYAATAYKSVAGNGQIQLGSTRATFLSQLIAVIIAVLTSAVYLVPAIGLRDQIHSGHLQDLFLKTSQYGFAVLDLFQGTFDWLRLLSIFTLICGILLTIQTWKSVEPSDRGWKWVAVVAIFFQLPFMSTLLWRYVPGMEYLQFSWRWNGMLLLAIAYYAARRKNSTSVCFAIALAVVTLFCELTIGRNILLRPPLPLNTYRMDAPEYAPISTPNNPYEVIGLTQRWAADSSVVALGFTLPSDSIHLSAKHPTEWNFSTSLSRETPVRFHMLYWPYWRAFRGQDPIALKPDVNGCSTAILPVGSYGLHLVLIRSPYESIGILLSYFGAALLIALLSIASYQTLQIRDRTIPPFRRSRS